MSVYISQEITTLTVVAKLRDATIGIVNEEYLLSSDLGFGSGTGSGFYNDINIVDNTHYITSAFSSGALALFDPAYDIYTGTGITLAPGADVLGETGSITGLMALEKGGALWDSGTAADRRVLVPWGDDFAALNTDGQTLMRRALEWAAANDVPPPDLLFVSGGSVIVQAPSGESLIVPTAQEQLKISLIEAWGYAVTLIHETDSQADYDTSVAASDVVYVSGEVSDSALGTKLKPTTLGLVNEQIDLHDEFGFSSSSDTNSFDKIADVDNTHEITDGFSTGFLTISTSSQPLQALVGTLAPGMQTLANVWISGANYDDGLALLDVGAELYDGGTAAGRRVQLPWGGSGFDFNALNGDGQTVMQRAIEWAAGAGTGGGVVVILLPTATSATRRSLPAHW